MSMPGESEAQNEPVNEPPIKTMLDLEQLPMDGLPERFGTNVASNYLGFAVAIGVSVLLTPLLIRNLGQEAFGVWSLALSVVAYLELLEFGFGTATKKLIAEDAGVRPAEVVRTLNTSFFTLTVLGCVALVLGVVMATAGPTWLDVPRGLRTEAAGAFAVLAVAMAISIPGDSFGGALAGHQRYDLFTAANTALVVLSGAVSAVVVLLGGGLIQLAITTAVISTAMHGLRWWLLRRIVPGLRLRPSLIDRARIRRTAWLSGWFLVRDVAATISFRIDLLVVAALFDVKQVAVYVVGTKLAKLAAGGLGPIVEVLSPHASALHRDGDAAQLEALLIDGTRTTLLAGLPVMILFTTLAHPIVQVWVGPGYASAAGILIAFATVIGLKSLVYPTKEVLEGMGYAKVLALVAVLEAVVNLSCSILLGRAIGLVGVALGTVVAAGVVNLPATFIFGTRVLGLSPRTFVKRAVAPHVLPSACMLAVVVGGKALFPEDALAALLGIAGTGGLMYLLLYWRTGATPVERERFRSILARGSQP